MFDWVRPIQAVLFIDWKNHENLSSVQMVLNFFNRFSNRRSNLSNLMLGLILILKIFGLVKTNFVGFRKNSVESRLKMSNLGTNHVSRNQSYWRNWSFLRKSVESWHQILHKWRDSSKKFILAISDMVDHNSWRTKLSNFATQNVLFLARSPVLFLSALYENVRKLSRCQGAKNFWHFHCPTRLAIFFWHLWMWPPLVHR